MIPYVPLTVRRVLIVCRHSQPQLPTQRLGGLFYASLARPLPLSAEASSRSLGVYRETYAGTWLRPHDHASMLLAYGGWSTFHS